MAKGLKTRKTLNKELSHVCWLLSEECYDNENRSFEDQTRGYLGKYVYYYGFSHSNI